MTSRSEQLTAQLKEHFGERLTHVDAVAGEVTCEVAAADLIEVCKALQGHDDFLFETLADLAGVDYLGYGVDEWRGNAASSTGFGRAVNRAAPRESAPGRRFAVVYHLLSVSHNRRLRLRCFCEDDSFPRVASVVPVWSGANWYEREAFDLFGILFDGHPDLRRILTDYGFIGHPFRKDFPLSGHVEVTYDPEKQRVVYQPVSIAPRTLVPRVIRDDNRYDEALLKDEPDA